MGPAWSGRSAIHFFSPSGPTSTTGTTAFQPKQGVESVKIKPGPVSPLQLVPPSLLSPSALFLYHPHIPSTLKAGAEVQEAWLYGATVQTESADRHGRANSTIPYLAVPTGRKGDVLKGVLLWWPVPTFQQKLHAADKLVQAHHPLSHGATLQRGVVSVVREDGSSAKAYWFFQAVVDESEVLTTTLPPSSRSVPTDSLPLSQVAVPSDVLPFSQVTLDGQPQDSPTLPAHPESLEPATLLDENDGSLCISATVVRDKDNKLVGFLVRQKNELVVGYARRKRADPEFVYKLGAETAISQGMALFTNLLVRGWNILLWDPASVAQYIVQVILEFFDNAALVWALTPQAHYTEAELCLVPPSEASSKRDADPNTIEHFFQRAPPSVTTRDRFNVVLEKSKFYGGIGFCTGLAGAMLFSLLDGRSFFLMTTWENILRIGLCNLTMMAIDSTPRYNIVSGLEMVAQERMTTKQAEMAIVAIRTTNLLIGSRMWIFFSNLFGVS
eukprot:gb/GEZN01005359.1/.p1 GENE.gb/GEZN01005359.1/~~gb/GEZN01005359.1/.p1  ORF type:complete len:520 (+),score=89.43 gb/GEZN01005359.1/:64-1560(+)